MDFNYEINPDDSTIKDIEMDKLFYNFDEINLHKFDESYESLYLYILYNDNIVNNYIYPKEGFNKKYVLNSILLWKKLGINLHNIDIFNKFFHGDKFILYDNRFINSFKNKSVSNLKVYFKNIEQWDSKLKFVEIDENNYKNVVADNIVLPRLEKKLDSTIYAHEITHTQLVTRDGGTNSIYYEETIPIFMEFIFASELDNSLKTLNYVKNGRLMSILKFINLLSMGNKLPYVNRVTSEKYIISSLQAIELFNIYYYSNDSIKKEMFKDINDIFDGNIIVEDIINKYEVDYNDNQKNIKMLKRFDF